MEQKPEDQQNTGTEDQQPVSESLEGNDADVVQAPAEGVAGQGNDGDTTDTTGGQKTREARTRLSVADRFSHINIYLLMFILLLVVAGTVQGILYLRSKQAKQSQQSISSQSLSSTSLDQLASSGVSVGDPKQVLTVQSNSIFAGKVLVRGDLEVAGKILVGSSLSLTGINVSGQSTFDDVQITKNISVTGNASIQGKLNTSGIAVSGAGTFGGNVTAGSITTNGLALNGDFTLTHHLVIGGSTPGRTSGSALGSGGTTSVSGSDTAGSISINTGSSPAVGCFITVNFAQKYNSTPAVIVTPIGSGAAAVNYYVNRSTTSFSVCGTSAAGSGQSFGFDYFVVE